MKLQLFFARSLLLREDKVLVLFMIFFFFFSSLKILDLSAFLHLQLWQLLEILEYMQSVSHWKTSIGMKMLFDTWKYSLISSKNAYFEVKASYACPRFNTPFL